MSVAWYSGLEVTHSSVEEVGGKMETVVPGGLVRTAYAGVVVGGWDAGELAIVKFAVSS